MRRGEIYYVDLGSVVGSEQGGIRPCLIVSNNRGNESGVTVIIVPFTTRTKHNSLPTHIPVRCSVENGLAVDSALMCEQIRTISKKRIKKCIGRISSADMARAERGIKITLEME